MTYDAKRLEQGHEYTEIARIVADTCSLSIGESPCTANRDVTGTVVRAMADRVYLDSSASAVSDTYNDTHQLAITSGTGSGQSEQVTDYVVESVTNSILYARDVSNAAWSKIGTPTYTQDRTGIFGDANAAWTVGDDDNTAYEAFRQDVTIANDSNTHYVAIAVGKDSDETRFPELQLRYVGGTFQTVVVQINTKTGEILERATTGTATSGVIESGNYWIVWAGLVNNSSGNVTARTTFYPAISTTWDAAEVSATGSCVIDNFQLRLNASSIGELIPTTSVAVTETVRVAYVKNDLSTIPAASDGYALIDRANACYNTRNTCLDTDNYTKTTTTLAFSTIQPVGEQMFPALREKNGITRQQGTVTGGTGLGNRATATARFNDFKDNDIITDPYQPYRTYDTTQGTFWGKWFARNLYYEGRTLEICRGYVSSPFSWDDFQCESYDITDAKGPINGVVTITGKDALVRTYGKKSVYPAQSEGYLSASITSGATSATLAPTGIGATDYPASGYVSIADEIMAFTRSGDVLTLTRAQWGSVAAAHDADDTVQLCAAWDTVNVLDAYEEVLLASGFVAANIPNGVGENWTDERSLWMASANIKGILAKPEPVEKVISEWMTLFMFDSWWDLVDKKVYIKALSPEPSGVTIESLGDNYDLVESSLYRMPDMRVTTAVVAYNKTNFAEDQRLENFKAFHIGTDPSAAGTDKYGFDSRKTFISRWFDSQGRATQLEGRIRARFGDTPEKIRFEITSKDEDKVQLAGRIQLTTDVKQDVTGASVASNYQVTSIEPNEDGSIIEAITSSFTGRYAFIGPTGLPDYSSATEDQKNRYAFISPASGTFSDGQPAYKII